VRQAVVAYVDAFNKKDLPALTAMWAAQATHTDRESGVRTEGRDAIVADIAAAFKEHPQSRLSGRVDRVRLLRPDIAMIEGQTSVGAPDEPPAVTTFTAILTSDKGKWLIDSIDETPVSAPATSQAALKDLEWLVGHWVDEDADAHVESTIRWSDSGAFLIRSFSRQGQDGESQQGTQVIGFDPRSREIRSWVFTSDGSFGDGVWSRSGDEWLIKSSQTLADGRAASGTYILTRVDKDTVTLRLIGHEIEGEPQPSGPSAKMVRVADAVAKPAPTPRK
jgi:uncharacterized protein (TIGR02246 family)